MVSRSFDQVIERVTVTTTPNHLWSRIIIRTRENESREQRHRYFSISSFLDVARQLGRDSDLGDAAKEPGNVGQFADISCRSRYHGAQEYLQALGGPSRKRRLKVRRRIPRISSIRIQRKNVDDHRPLLLFTTLITVEGTVELSGLSRSNQIFRLV